LVGGIEATDGYIRSYLPQVVLSVATPLLIAAVVAAVDPLSALVLVLTYPLIPLFMYLIGGVARERTRRQWVTLSRMSARFLDAIQGLATLKAFGRSVDEAAVIATAMADIAAVTMGVLKVAFISALVLELLSTLGTAIVAVEVGLRLLYARVAFDAALFVLVLAPEFYRPLRSLGAAFHAGMAGKEAGARIAALLDETPELPTAPRGRSEAGPAGVATAPPPQRSHGGIQADTLPPSSSTTSVSATGRAGALPSTDSPSGWMRIPGGARRPERSWEEHPVPAPAPVCQATARAHPGRWSSSR